MGKVVRKVISRNGICYDLQVSEFRCETDRLTFVFSSALHLEKFKKRRDDHRKSINASLTKRFGFDIDVSALADVILYRKIETRGFLIVTSEGIELCQRNNITYVGGTAISPSYNAQ